MSTFSTVALFVRRRISRVTNDFPRKVCVRNNGKVNRVGKGKRENNKRWWAASWAGNNGRIFCIRPRRRWLLSVDGRNKNVIGNQFSIAVLLVTTKGKTSKKEFWGLLYLRKIIIKTHLYSLICHFDNCFVGSILQKDKKWTFTKWNFKSYSTKFCDFEPWPC